MGRGTEVLSSCDIVGPRIGWNKDCKDSMQETQWTHQMLDLVPLVIPHSEPRPWHAADH